MILNFFFQENVKFSKPFASKPLLVVATSGIYLKADGWWAFWADYKSLTTEGFRAQMTLHLGESKLVESFHLGEFKEYVMSWIACGQM